MKKTARVIIIDDDKLLVFFRRKEIDGNIYTYYAIPGGHLEDNETLEETAIREIKEEMNLDIEILGYLGNLVIDNQEENYYHGKIIGGKLQKGCEALDGNSDSNYYEIRWLPISELDNSGIRALSLVRRALNNEYED